MQEDSHLYMSTQETRKAIVQFIATVELGEVILSWCMIHLAERSSSEANRSNRSSFVDSNTLTWDSRLLSFSSSLGQTPTESTRVHDEHHMLAKMYWVSHRVLMRDVISGILTNTWTAFGIVFAKTVRASFKAGIIEAGLTSACVDQLTLRYYWRATHSRTRRNK